MQAGYHKGHGLTMEELRASVDDVQVQQLELLAVRALRSS